MGQQLAYVAELCHDFVELICKNACYVDMGESSPVAPIISMVSKYWKLDMPRTSTVFPAKPQQYRLILVSSYILSRIGCG